MVVAASLIASAGLVQGADSKNGADIVDTAVAAGKFKTLAAALQAADLIKALKGEGPFTVLAPTDEAFAKLPEGTVESLLKPENKAKLTAILTYHVVPGQLLAADVVKQSELKTLEGRSINVNTKDGVKFNNASPIATDVMASNGVIHIIDTVLLPPEKKDGVSQKDLSKEVHQHLHAAADYYRHGHYTQSAQAYSHAVHAALTHGMIPAQSTACVRAAVARADAAGCDSVKAWNLMSAARYIQVAAR